MSYHHFLHLSLKLRHALVHLLILFLAPSFRLIVGIGTTTLLLSLLALLARLLLRLVLLLLCAHDVFKL